MNEIITPWERRTGQLWLIPANTVLIMLVSTVVIGLSLNPVYGLAILTVMAVLTLIMLPLSAVTVAATTILLVVLPDSPNLFDIARLQVTPRIFALILILLQLIIGVCRARVSIRFTFAAAWSVYAMVVLVGAVLANRYQAVPLFLLLAMAPYCVGCTLGADTQLLRGVLRGMVLGLFILAIIAVTEFILHKNFLSPVYNVVGGEYARAGNVRANAGWLHPLDLGMFFCLGAFIAIEEARRRGAVFAALAALLVAGGIFATQERSPLIGFVAGVLVFILLQVNARMRIRALAFAGVAVLAVAAVPGSSGASFRQFLSQSTAAHTTAGVDVVGRFELLRLGIHAITTRPLFGFGYGVGVNVRNNALLDPLLTHGNTIFTDIANWPLTIGIETGLLGLATFAAIVGSNLVRMVIHRAAVYPLPMVPAIAGVIAALVTSLGVASIPSSLLFVFILGIYSTGYKSNNKTYSANQSHQVYRMGYTGNG